MASLGMNNKSENKSMFGCPFKALASLRDKIFPKTKKEIAMRK